MLVEVKVPQLAESVADATLMGWLKQPGEQVKMGENLIDLETDKVTLEVTAPQDGVLTELRHQEGDTVLADDVLAVIDTEGVAETASTAAAPAAETEVAQQPGQAAKQSPAVRKLVAEQQVDVAAVAGSGNNRARTPCGAIERPFQAAR